MPCRWKDQGKNLISTITISRLLDRLNWISLNWIKCSDLKNFIIFWFHPPELIFQTCKVNKIIFLFLVSVPPTDCQNRFLPIIVHILRGAWVVMLHTHKPLSPFPFFTRAFYFPPPLFLFHAPLRGPIPSLRAQGCCTWRGQNAEHQSNTWCTRSAEHLASQHRCQPETKDSCWARKKKSKRYWTMFSACNSVYLD